MRRLLLIAFALLLSGCMAGPDYKRPDVNTPQAFHYEEKDAQNTANTDWWKAFNDPVLDSLINESLANNLNVKIAAANVEQAAGFLTQTRSGLFPQASYGASGAREHVSGASNAFNSYNALAGATWEIDLWGRIRRLTEAARANMLATEEARRGVILSLTATVANSYIQLRGFDDQLEVSKRTLASYAESLKLFELQFQHGQVSQMIVEQSRSQYETAAAVIPNIESQIVQTETALCILLGRNPGPIPRGKTIAQLGMPAIPAGLPSELLTRRPDLAQAEQNLIAANAQIGAAKALYFPSISLTGAYGTQSTEFDNLFKGSSRTWSYGGSVTGPIFTAGAISGQVTQAKAAQEAALLSYKNAIISAFGDMENSLSARQKLSDQTKAQEALVTSLREYGRLAWLQYNEGYTQYLTVLYAESQLFTAELSYIQTKSSYLNAFVNIYKAMGGGWVNNAEKLTQPDSNSVALKKK
jgi:outer membrane protein, multidrug efflux system